MKTRYFIAFVAAALLLSGCEENEMRRSAVNDGWLKIKIAGLQMTKGTLFNSETELLTGGIDTFTVAAWNSDYSSFVSAQKVRYDSEASEWGLAEPKMWTGSDVKTFFAYTNLPGKDTATISQVFTEEAQKQTLTYKLPLDARAQNDIMLGAYQGTGGGDFTADITFFHPLTSVIFRAGAMPAGMAINKVTLSGIYAQGSVDVTYTYESGPVPHYNWGESRDGSVDATLEPVSGTEGIEINASTKIIGVPFVVFPQEIAAGDVQIILEATLNEEAKTLAVDVPATEWLAGQTNVYTLGYGSATGLELAVTRWGAKEDIPLPLDVEAPVLLSGKFSINATEYVQFSRGNLFCTRSGEEGSYEYEFGFEQNQYDYRCMSGKSGDQAVIDGATTTTPASTSGLFQWVPRTSTFATDDWGAFSSYSTTVSDDTDKDVLDFGGVFPSSNWTTLTAVQWKYILDNHKNKIVSINGVKGLALAPDDYEGDIPESFTLEQWAAAESLGMVFLPLYSFYSPSDDNINTPAQHCAYWSSSPGSYDANSQYQHCAIALYVQGNLSIKVENRWRYYGQNVRLVKKSPKVIPAPKFVDLGLPSGTLWADRNLGAVDEQNVGNYYSWGETNLWYESISGNVVTMKSEYTNFTETEYNSKSNMKTANKSLTDENIMYDVANVTYGDPCHLPSEKEIEELLDNCYFQYTESYNGQAVQGYIIYKAKHRDDRGKKSVQTTPNSALVETYDLSDTHIFMPFTGYVKNKRIQSGGLDSGNSGIRAGYYWSNQSDIIVGQSKAGAWRFAIGSSFSSPNAIIDRFPGLAVRAVKTVEKPEPPVLLSGKFSINATEEVQFSRGNLQATLDGDGKPTAWKFARNQYDVIYKDGANTKIGSSAGDIDLFGWSSSTGVPYGIGISTDNADYSGDFVDWGTAVSGDWKTLSKGDWEYLLKKRETDCVLAGIKARFVKSQVGTCKGLLLLPDHFEWPSGVTSPTKAVVNVTNANYGYTCSLGDFQTLEEAGAVFLPLGSTRSGNTVTELTTWGYYWTSTSSSGTQADYLLLGSGSAELKSGTRNDGYSVRLVKKSPKPHDAVKIGNLYWATMNVGATSVAGSPATCFGDYFAWGETEPYYTKMTVTNASTASFDSWKSGKTSGYSWNSYCNSSEFTEWNPIPYNPTTEVLKPEYDAANANWGGDWRMPTKDDYKSLLIACTGDDSSDKVPVALPATITEGGVYWSDNYEGVSGILFVDKSDISKRVFFPAAGYVGNTAFTGNGSGGYYWLSSYNANPPGSAYDLGFYNTIVYKSDNNKYSRFYGFPIRPVMDAPAE